MIEPLFSAIQHGDVNEVIRLLGLGSDLNARNEQGYTPLIAAIVSGRVEVVRALLVSGADPNLDLADAPSRALRDFKEGRLSTRQLFEAILLQGSRPLSVASRLGYDSIARILLEYGCDPNLPIDGYKSPLAEAISAGHDVIVEILLRHGANPQAMWKGKTPMILAIESNRPDIVSILGRFTTVGLREAAVSGNIGLLQQMLNHTSVDEVERDAALRLASEHGHLEAVSHLLLSGSNVNSRDPEGRTALVCACSANQLEVVRALLAHGADLALAESTSGMTPIMFAIRNKNLDITRLLLSYDATTASLEISPKSGIFGGNLSGQRVGWFGLELLPSDRIVSRVSCC